MDRTADEVPIAIEPDPGCRWRWLDSSALACELGDGALRPATRYSLVVQPTIVALDGSTLAAPVQHAFETERPRIAYAWFSTWRGPGSPVVRVVLNQPVTAAALRERLVFELAEAGLRFGVEVEPDPEGEAFAGPRAAPADDRSPSDQALQDSDARRVWLVTPTEPLPGAARASLLIEPGLRSAEGELPGNEARTVVEFDTFPDFRFAGVTCTTNDQRQVLIRADGTGPDVRCNPLGGMGLSFTAPIVASEVRDSVAFTPDLAGGRDDYDPWANVYDFSQLGQPHEAGRTYTVWLPGRLEAAATYRVTSNNAAPPEDEFGRVLAAPIDVEIRTDHRPPDYTLAHSTAVLEAGVDSDMPLYVTNLSEVTLDYRVMTDEGAESGRTATLAVPAVEDLSFAVPLDIRSLLGGRTGALHATLTTRPELDKSVWERRLFAQVTPYQVHVKLGHFNTLVWVTDFATGEPVTNAQVSIYTDRIADLRPAVAPISEAETDGSGLALLSGSAQLDPALDLLGYGCSTHPDECPRLFVRVDGPLGLALLPLDDRFEASVYRASSYAFGPQPAPAFGHLVAWGTTAQGVYRAGDTMAFKLYVRDQSNDSLVAAPEGPYSLEILDPTGQPVHTLENITLSKFGAYSGEFEIPQTAAVGWYRFKLTAGFDARTASGAQVEVDDDPWSPTRIVRYPMRVLVSDFTPASFAVTTRIDGDHFGADDAITVETRAALHSGGAYTDAEARITARLIPRRFVSSHPVASRFSFDAADETRAVPQTLTIAQRIDQVDAEGRLRHEFVVPPEAASRIAHGRLEIEGAVRDDRGGYVAAAASANFVAVDRLAGLRTTRWVFQQGEPAEVEWLVVDRLGVPAAGADVEIAIERLETRASRVKGAGNAYLTRYVDEWIAAGECRGRSSEAPSACVFTPEAPGAYRLIASVEDDHGRVHRTMLRTWVAGRGHVVWSEGNDDALEIVPEAAEYAVGQSARFLIKNPYPGARALVTIERFGVLTQWVETLETSTPIIEFEVEEDFLPGFYLSVLVMSPRVEGPPPEVGELDLGKPAFKLGYVQVPVNDPAKRLDVVISTDSDVYEPGATVRASIEAANREGRDEPIELAVVVLDEAVLDLIQGGVRYFDPYAGFYSPGPLDVRNFSLLTRLVGRQKIELKGANPGGDGGAAFAMRSIFEHVAHFAPSLELGADGKAEIEFTLPDNLTGWRILALAVTPTEGMGLGTHRFAVNQPTEIRSAMPNQVAEGDRFTAAFTVTNRTDTARELTVTVRAEGDVATPVAHEERVQLAPFARTVIRAPIEAGRLAFDRSVAEGRIRFSVTAEDAVDADGLVHDLPVRKQAAIETAAVHGMLDGDRAREPLRVPPDIRPDAGEIAVVLSPTVLGNLEGAFRDARRYVHPSWEQRLTRAVMASVHETLEAYLPEELEWPDREDAIRVALSRAADFQAPNGGMAYFRPEDGHVDPYLSAYTALALGWLREAGHAVPETVEARLYDYLDDLLRRDVAPGFYSRGMAATARAVALAALAKRGRLTAADLERYRGHVERMSLFGKAHYLAAALSVDGAAALAAETLEALLNSANRTSSKLSFNEVLDAAHARLIATPVRANCAILGAFAAAGERAAELGVDRLAPALARHVVDARGAREGWSNAQENVYCTLALADYARRWEAAAPRASVDVDVNGERLGSASFDAARDPAVTIARPLRASDADAPAEVVLERRGEGRVYYTARLQYAPAAPSSRPLHAGVELTKAVSVQRDGEWVPLDAEGPIQVARADLVRVDLFVSLPAARHFLFIEDPVPGGLEPVSRDLATASSVDADAAAPERSAQAGWMRYGASRWSFHHQELGHDAVRFYSDYLPAGRYVVSYTAQAIAEGEFAALPPKAQAMYDPSLFGTDAARSLVVEAP